MKLALKRSLFGAVLLGLAACGGMPYKPYDGGTGYAEQKLESNRYRVSYYGGYGVTLDMVENYVLYRAAELTLAGRYDYFTVVARSAEGKPEYYDPGYGLYGRFGAFGIGPGGVLGLGLATGTPIRSAFEGHADIFMRRGRKPANNPLAYDARELKRNLEPLIARPQP